MARFARAASAELPQGFSLYSGTGPNVLLMKAPDGAVLVDSGAEAGGARVLEQLKMLGGNNYTLFNTH